MKPSRTRIAALMSWGMIPLALWSGLPTTACQCPDGSIKLFCSGVYQAVIQHASANSKTAAEVRRSVHKNCCHAKATRPPSCCDHPSSGKPCGKCKAIGRTATTVVELVSPPGFDDQASGLYALDLSFAPSAQPVIFSRNVELLDTGPPVDLVLVHHSFLI